MKLTIEQLERKYNKAKQDEAEALQRLEEQQNEVARLKEAEAEAAAAGDLSRYQEIKRKRTDLEDMIFVTDSVLQKKRGKYVDSKEVADVWHDYAGGYNKEIARRMKEYNQTCAALKSIFMGMVELQNNALIARQRCAQMSGTNKIEEDLPMQFVELPKTQHAFKKPFVKNNIALAFDSHLAPVIALAAHDMISYDEAERIRAIIDQHNVG